MMNKELPQSSVDDIKTIEVRGPWRTKSNADLAVLYALPKDALEAFLDFDNPAFDAVQKETGTDIRGLRSYTVTGISKGSEGGYEWHKARTECVMALDGSASLLCIDTQGNQRTFVLDGKTAVVVPSMVFHVYTALEDNTRLQVMCNTLYIPEDTGTYDTFDQASFDELRAQIAERE